MNYKIIRSKRKTLSLEITADCRVLVRAPLFISSRKIEEFVNLHEKWIDDKLIIAEKRFEKNLSISEDKEKLTAMAREMLPPLVEKYSKLTGLEPKSVKITSAAKRFGSCSSKNGICFSYRLMAYPIEAVEYVVLHEIAHIKHHNHSKAFYNFIEGYMPDYKTRLKLLK